MGGRPADGGAVAPADARTPLLALDGFDGPLARLLELAREHRVDLARLSLAALLDQLVAALGRAAPLGDKADWVVMAASLLQLRSRLLPPFDAPARRAAEDAAGRLRGRLLGLAEVQALARWLDGRPRLGRDAFARGAPEVAGFVSPGEAELDVVAFLWACVDLFDADPPRPDAAEWYAPPPRADLHSVADARARILRRLADAPDGRTLDQLLPEATGVAVATPAPATPGPDAKPSPHASLRRRSAWSSTFAAGLELAKRGDVALAQDAASSPVHLALAVR